MYAKVFRSIWSSSLVKQREGKWVFIALLTMADGDGVVEDRPEVIAAKICEPLEFVLEGIRQLESPDEFSKSTGEEGRRIVRLRENQDWGWRIVNYLQYRAMRDENARREQTREATRRWREKNRVSQGEPEVSQGKPRRAQEEEEEEEEVSSTSPSETPKITSQPDTSGARQAHSSIKIPLNDGRWYSPSKDLMTRMSEIYPAVDVEAEYRKMAGWCEANRARRKTARGIERFCNAWLSRAQDNGHGNGRSDDRPDPTGGGYGE